MDAELARHYIVRTMTAAEVPLAIEWAANEGWNPGRDDARCFRAADPGGFFVGELHGEPVASISAVAYDAHFGFIGLYIVRPEFRGKGLGLRLWQHAMDYLGGRNVGLDGVVAQQANYRKSGFQLAHRNIRFQGVAHGAPASAAITDLSTVPFDQLAAYDRRWFPAARADFLKAWIAQPDVIALASIRDGLIGGYGVLRACRQGRKIGPLFADDALTAEELFDALLSRCADETVSIDVPESNAAAIAMAERHGMSISFETARMYTHAPPDISMARVFGITSFELG
ncbi:GNAT family N-acetyltransferase [Paraburkholderia sp. MMS20-SJTR3]|uniref:GNAT family N-acetyltransferase n=1 Tax=Paraburkholderia sejongensis TaxID=2886946 RepID=A0ABS8JQY8_9BURK|nr:GNAT family N-acetyltransferase [Paraburkholderia sp. MMS20-SJTR3]MCC8392160.1 GNAT family N-acetyltransferase [Paraburkholderia sp. MMS20-SJTR3]